jgi:UDP-glucose 4-epimerase
LNILVTGGAGYIGSITCQELAKAGFTPIVYDSLEKGHREAVADFELIIGETQDWKFLVNVLRSKKIQAVIHFAAYIEMGESMQKPEKYFYNNLYGSMSLFKAMLTANVKKIVFSSSAGVYGQPETLPIKESASRNPNNPYGETKKMVEDILVWYSKIHNFQSISLRYFNACGAALNGSLGENHKPETHLIPNILKAVLKNEEFNLFGSDYPTSDGTCIRDYIHVLDLAEAHILALKALKNDHKTDFYNLGTGKGYSNKQIIDGVEKVTGKKVKVKLKPRRPGDVAELVADSNKFKNEFSWEPKHSDLQTIISSAWQWQQKL